MIWSISWKNVWRNKLRSSIVILSISFGLLGGVFSMAFMNGWADQSIQNIISTDLSNIQLHNPNYLLNDEVKFVIHDAEKKLNQIRANKNIAFASRRIKITAMATSANSGMGVVVRGVNPADEKLVTSIHSKLVEGTYFDSKLRYPAVIGKSLAKKLKIKLNSKLIVTFQSMTGDIIYEAFRVVGIFKTDNSMFDRSSVFVVDKDLAKSISFDTSTSSEIAIYLNDSEKTDIVSAELKQLFKSEVTSEELVIRTWNEIQPAFEMMNEMTKQFSFIFIVVILFALSFGIINTMLMVVLERIHELGMLMAIGMSKARIFFMILLETIFLATTGGVFGLIFSFTIIEITGNSGIDLSIVAEGMNAYGYSAFVYPKIAFPFYFIIAILVILMAMFASILPAKKAIKLNPAEAVRHEA